MTISKMNEQISRIAYCQHCKKVTNQSRTNFDPERPELEGWEYWNCDNCLLTVEMIDDE